MWALIIRALKRLQVDMLSVVVFCTGLTTQKAAHPTAVIETLKKKKKKMQHIHQTQREETFFTWE